MGIVGLIVNKNQNKTVYVQKQVSRDRSFNSNRLLRTSQYTVYFNHACINKNHRKVGQSNIITMKKTYNMG